MEIKGKSDFTETAAVELPNGIEIIVNSLPFGFHEEMAELLPSPVAPLRPIRDDKGNYVYKDPKKRGAFKTAPDEQDPAYVKASTKQVLRQAAYFIYNGTRLDPNLTWTAKPDTMDPEAFYEAIQKEIQAAGLGMGHVEALSKKIMNLSGVTDERIQEISGHFLASAE